jgi:hypothetical protein
MKRFWKKDATAVAVLALCVSTPALAMGRFSIVPYASVSSTKAIKPSESKDSSEESINQRTTYGLKIDVRLFSLLTFSLQGGTNVIDKTKKQSAVRDEFKEIDFEKDLNLDTTDPKHEYRYQEEQRLGTAKLLITPRLGRYLWLKVGGGVRARQRLINLTDKENNQKVSIKDPIRYHAVATAGAGVRLFSSVSAQAEYNFTFIKFPKTEPHEQEVLVGFGISI